MVFQGYALWPHMTVSENVRFGLEMMAMDKAERAQRVSAALSTVRIEHLAERKPHELSGGQQQRVALARTLVVEPACLLLDEPLANLDAQLRREMRAEIRRICKQAGLTAVYVTHDRHEALSMSDRVAVMAEGRILQVGPPDQVYRRPKTRFVAEFIGETNFIPGRLKSLQGDTAVVESACGILACNPENVADLAAGAEVTVSLRPESFRILAAAPESLSSTANLLRVRLSAAAYLGEIAEYQTATLPDTDLALRIFELNPGSTRQAGEELTLQFAASDAVLLPADA
jgi:iron(III) transport system ATP-binding protein